MQLSVKKWSVRNWETGRTKPAIGFMPRIFEFLGSDPHPSGQTIGEQLVTALRPVSIQALVPRSK